MAQLEESHSASLEALGSAIDLRDGPTAGHSRRVFWYSIKIAAAIGGLEKEIRNLGMGAWLHDIGKLAIPDAILLKPGVLDESERQAMQQHVRIGYELVRRIPFLTEAAEIILAHHERCDGSGYPQGLKADDIPIGARIFAVADSFDAMTSDRPYRSALSLQAGREEIQRGAGKLFDTRVVSGFLAISVMKWETIREEAARVPISSVVSSGRLSVASSEERSPVLELRTQLENFAGVRPDEGRFEKTPCQPKPV